MEDILARVHVLVSSRLDESSLDRTVRSARSYVRRMKVEIPAEVKLRGSLQEQLPELRTLARRRRLAETGVQPEFIRRAASASAALMEQELSRAVAGALRVLPLRAAPAFVAGMARAMGAVRLLPDAPALAGKLLNFGKTVSEASQEASQAISQAGDSATSALPTLEEAVAEIQRRHAQMSASVASAYSGAAERASEAASAAAAATAQAGAELAAAESATGEAIATAGQSASAQVATSGKAVAGAINASVAELAIAIRNQFPELSVALSEELAGMVKAGQITIGEAFAGIQVGVKQWRDIFALAGIDPTIAARDAEVAIDLFADALATAPNLFASVGLTGQAQIVAASVAIDRAASELGASVADVGAKVSAAAALASDQIAAAIQSLFPGISARVARQFAGMVATGELTIEEMTSAIRTGMERWSEILRAVGVTPGASVEQTASAFRTLSNAIAGTPIQALEEIGLKGKAQIVALTVALRESVKAIKPENITAIKNTIRQQLALLGVEGVPKAIIDTAAKAVQTGVLTAEQAVSAIMTGYKESSKVMRESGESAITASRKFAALSESLEKLSAVPPSGGGPPGAAPPAGELPTIPSGEAARVLAVASAFDQARKSARGFMRSLMDLRWQVFTVMFFGYFLQKSLRTIYNAALEGARSVDRVTNAILVLRAAGVTNIKDLAREMQSAAAGAMTQWEAVVELSRLAALGLPPELIELAPEMMRLSSLFALVTGEVSNQREAFEKWTDSIARGEIRMVRTAGMVSGNLGDLLELYKRNSAESARYSEALAKVVQMLEESGIAGVTSTEQLNQMQKSLLIVWAVMFYGTAAAEALGTSFDRLTSDANKLEQAVNDVKAALQATLGVAMAPHLSRLAESIYAAYGSFIKSKKSAEEIAEAYQKAAAYIQQLPAEEMRARLDEIIAGSRRLGVTGVNAWKAYGTELARAYMPAEAMVDLTEEQVAALGYLLERFMRVEIGAGGILDPLIDDGRANIEITDEQRERFEQLRQVLQEVGIIAEDTAGEVRSLVDDVTQALRQAGQMFLEWLRWEEDLEIERRRWEEDLARERQKRLRDAEEELRKSRPKLRKDYTDRLLEAERDYQRRLEKINEELADRLRSIWRDYYDDMLRAEMDRDAESAFWAARRRDREIQEAHEAAERQRADAYRAYQDAIENAQKQYEEQLALLRERYQQELEEIRRWEEMEREERAIRERREREDREREANRRLQDLMRDLMLEYELQKIANDQTLSEEEKFRRSAAVIMSAYSRDQITITTDMVNALKGLHINYFGFLYQQFGQLRNTIQMGGATTLTAVRNTVQSYLNWLNSAISYTVSLLSALRSMAGSAGVSFPGTSRPGVQPRARGGIDIVTGPTHFIAGEAGPELVITQPLRREGGYPVQIPPIALTHQLNAVVRAEVAGLTGQIEATVTESLERLFRSGFHKVRGW